MSHTPAPFDFAAHLKEPSPQGWHACAVALDALWLAGGSVLGARALNNAVALCKRTMLTWPTAARQCVPREPLKHWRRATNNSELAHDQLLDLCLKVKHESQTYGYYETYICNAPELLWPDGQQQCHLARAFTGAVRGIKSESWLRIGEPGQGDLIGWLSVDLPPYGVVAVKLECEIKMPSGTLSKKQRARRDELARAGAIYISAKSVASAVGQVCAARDALVGARWQHSVGQVGTMEAALQAIEVYRSANGW